MKSSKLYHNLDIIKTEVSLLAIEGKVGKSYPVTVASDGLRWNRSISFNQFTVSNSEGLGMIYSYTLLKLDIKKVKLLFMIFELKFLQEMF